MTRSWRSRPLVRYRIPFVDVSRLNCASCDKPLTMATTTTTTTDHGIQEERGLHPGPRSHNGIDEEKGLHRTTTGVTMSPELFEKLYLTPKVPHVGDYNKRFANPTALGFVGSVSSRGPARVAPPWANKPPAS